MAWNLVSDRPIYIQLVDRIKLGILSGEFPAGSRMPSVRDLAAEAGVNPNTMQKALSELERDGFLTSQRTSGRFVSVDDSIFAQVKESLAMEAIEEFLEKMARLGFDREQVAAMIASFVPKEEH
ncbi:MAG: GntR family transcriptional regulator [Angelakisella sp.]|nr:GntR family transcriptional regulator [Angelakisella sp.]